MPIRPRSMDAPSRSWGNCQVIPFFVSLPAATGVTNWPSTGIFQGSVYIPYTFRLYGWFYAVGTMTGGGTISHTFAVHLQRSAVATAGFSATVLADGTTISYTGLVAQDKAFVDKSASPQRFVFDSVSPWTSLRFTLGTSSADLTVIGSLQAALYVMQCD